MVHVRDAFRRRRLILAGCMFAVVFSTAMSASAQQRSATCSTFNGSNEPTSKFKTGDIMVVRGTGFGAGSVVLVSLQQDTRNVELGRVSANDLGAFTLSGVNVPDTVVAGAGVVRALDARGSATCSITVGGVAEGETSDSMHLVYVIWGSALALFGAFLAVLTYRRWKTQRLRTAVEGFEWRERYEEPRAVEDDTDADDVDFEDFRAPVEMETDEAPRFEPPDVSEPDPDLEPSDEPPMLPVGWDHGRLRPNRQTSDAISRLRREVKSWKDDGRRP